MRPNARGNLGPSAMAARGTTAPMRLMLRNHRRCQRHFHHLMPRRFGIAGLGRLRQRSLATLTRGGPIVHGLVDPTEWKTSARMTRMTGLSARFAPGRRFAWTLGRLRWIARRRPRGVRRVLLELRFEVPNALLQLGDSGLKRRPHLPDDFIPLPTPRTLRLRRHLYFIGPAPRYTTRESGGVNGYHSTTSLPTTFAREILNLESVFSSFIDWIGRHRGFSFLHGASRRRRVCRVNGKKLKRSIFPLFTAR